MSRMAVSTEASASVWYTRPRSSLPVGRRSEKVGRKSEKVTKTERHNPGRWKTSFWQAVTMTVIFRS
jgi:hypothetical protein